MMSSRDRDCILDFGDLGWHPNVLLRLGQCTLINIGRKNKAEGDHVRSSKALSHSLDPQLRSPRLVKQSIDARV